MRQTGKCIERDGLTSDDRNSPNQDPEANLTPEQQDRLILILDEYLQCLERGETHSTDRLLRENSDLNEALQYYLPSLELLNGVDDRNRFPTALSTAPSQSQDQLPTAVSHSKRASATAEVDGLDTFLLRPSKTRARQLGPYRLKEMIGQGAMGIVYRAWDTKHRRNVAVKVLAPDSILDATRIERFRLEAKVAASLNHPHVVPVYTVGDDAGIHYYAMKLIRGESLDQCLLAVQAAEALEDGGEIPPTVEELAAPLSGDHRFVRLAEWCANAARALHAAHQAGIIHRDVKPSNLMLGVDGQIWVTDFGLARAQSHAGLTRTGELVGTLRYMSPEQASGDDQLIDARTDIYSLGITFYELLTRRPAFAQEETLALLKAIRSSEPIRPRELDRSIPKDLENILLRAMRPYPGDRYATATAFADDLQRFASGKPVRTSGVTRFEKALSWLRLHQRTARWILFAWLAVVFGACSLAFVISRAQMQTNTAMQQSDLHFKRARDLVDQLGVQVAEDLADIPSAAHIRQHVLSETRDYYVEFLSAAKGDRRLNMEAAKTHLELARLSRMEGDAAAARTSFQDAIRLFERHEDRRTAFHNVQFVETLNEFAQMESSQGDHLTALQLINRAMALAEYCGDDPTHGCRHKIAAATHNNRGVILLRQGKIWAARIELGRALESWDALPALARDDYELRSELANTLSNISVVLMKDGQLDEAASAAERAIELHNPATAHQSGELMTTLSNLAALHWKSGHPGKSIRVYQAIVSKLAAQTGDQPESYECVAQLAVALNNLGMVLAATSAYPEAEESFHRAEKYLDELANEFPENRAISMNLAAVRNNLSSLLRHRGRNGRANQIFREALHSQNMIKPEEDLKNADRSSRNSAPDQRDVGHPTKTPQDTDHHDLEASCSPGGPFDAM